MKKTILGTVTALMCFILLISGAVGCKESGQAAGEAAASEETSEEATVVKETAEETAASEEDTGETIATENNSETITVIDGSGREVIVTKPVSRVAVGIQVPSEIMKILGVDDRIVAIDRVTAASDFIYSNLMELPLIQTEDNHYIIDSEKIIELSPDVFITAVLPLEGFEDVVSTLEPEISVIALSYNTTEEILANVELMGKLFDREEEAAEYMNFYKSNFDMITERVADLTEEEKKRVYFEMLPYFSINDMVPVYSDLIFLTGGSNILGEMEQMYGQVDPEWIIEEDPEVIISQAVPYSFGGYEPVESGYKVNDYTGIEAFRDSVLNRSELSEVTAVKEGNVYIIQSELPQTCVVGLAYMAKWLHPELFEDLDPKALHQEYLTRFLGIDYDLDKHGVFVYPEP